jgi:hypothetical protein
MTYDISRVHQVGWLRLALVALAFVVKRTRERQAGRTGAVRPDCVGEVLAEIALNNT